MIDRIKNIHVLVFGIVLSVLCINILAITSDIEIFCTFITANCVIGIVLGVILSIISIFKISDCNGYKGTFFQ